MLAITRLDQLRHDTLILVVRNPGKAVLLAHVDGAPWYRGGATYISVLLVSAARSFGLQQTWPSGAYAAPLATLFSPAYTVYSLSSEEFTTAARMAKEAGRPSKP